MFRQNNPTGNKRSAALLAAILLLMSFLLFSLSACKMAPKPTNEEILEAVRISNERDPSPLDLDYTDMEVPNRGYGSARAILWIPDKSIQRNFTIRWDEDTGTFQVADYITLEKRDDNSYYEITE